MTAAARAYPHPKDAHVSARMRRNRKFDSQPEVQVRSALHAHGLRFRKHYPICLEGRTVRPDVVFTRKRVAVFVDGCFWHCCPEHGTRPSFNSDYWGAKLSGNVARDRLVDAALQNEGWISLRIWEHEAAEVAARRVSDAVFER